MKINRYLPFLLLALLGCGDAKEESLVKDFEKSLNPGADIEVTSLEKSGDVTGADSLRYCFEAYRPTIGFTMDSMKHWSPDTMVAHYKKMDSFYKTAINAYRYSISASKENKTIQQYTSTVDEFLRKMNEDSSRLAKMEMFKANQDSVFAVRFIGQLVVRNENGSKEEKRKTYVFSADRARIVGVSQE
jgi:hypothetical protein